MAGVDPRHRDAAEHERRAANRGRRAAGPQGAAQHVPAHAEQPDMQHDRPCQERRHAEQPQQDAGRIEDAGLRVGLRRKSAEIVGIPERHPRLLQGEAVERLATVVLHQVQTDRYVPRLPDGLDERHDREQQERRHDKRIEPVARPGSRRRWVARLWRRRLSSSHVASFSQGRLRRVRSK